MKSDADVAVKTQVNRLLITMQYHDCFDSETSHGYFDIFTNDNHYHAGNLLLGITNKKCRFGHLSISSGLGLFWGYFEDYDREYFTTIGLPVEAAISVNLFPFVGLNLKSFANINSRHSSIGFGMDIQIGKLRDIDWSSTIRF